MTASDVFEYPLIAKPLTTITGAVAYYSEFSLYLEATPSAFETIETYQELQSIELKNTPNGDLIIRPYTRAQRQDIVSFIRQEGKFYFGYYGTTEKNNPRGMDIFIAANNLNPTETVKYWLIYQNDNLAGIIQQYQTPKLANISEYDLRLSPYSSVYLRGTRLMKTAYTALAAALAEIENRLLTYGETSIDNKPMHALFTAAGLNIISEGPVCPLDHKHRNTISCVFGRAPL